jgi:hypothetical protein
MADEQNEHASYGLVVSFPDQSASFVHGFEAGALDERMKAGAVAEIEATTHDENREVIRRLADYQGWSVEVKPSGVPGWDYTILRKERPARERPNPHGLRIVP